MTYGDFAWEEVKPPPSSPRKVDNMHKIIITVGGEKGHGKTSVAMGLPGRIYTICMDGKAFRVWESKYKFDKRITVLDGKKFIKHKKLERHTADCEKTYRWIMYLLEQIRKRGDADWIYFDASDRLLKIVEMKMRHKERLSPFQGVTNRGAWNLRNFDSRQIHDTSLDIARYGLLYTTFREIVEVEEEGKVTTKYKPSWTKVIKEETDIYMESIEDLKRTKKGLQAKFKILVVSSKYPQLLKTGEQFEITDSNLTRWLKLHGRFGFFKRFERPERKATKKKKKKKKFLK